jgi:peptidoglycan hydrolase-like protein with peptidoglycan-binding domain
MVAYQRLFAPPRQDDLEYLPDPMGRLDMGTYVEKPETGPDPGWEAARGDWMSGAPLGRIFGDGLFDLQAGVGAGQANRRGDVFKLQALLHREGFLDAAATEGPTGFWGGRDDDALRQFQKEHGLSADGFVAPGGETISTIRSFYQPRRSAGYQTMEQRRPEPDTVAGPLGLGKNKAVPPTLLSAPAGGPQFAQANTGVVSDVPPGSGAGRDERPLLSRGQDRRQSILEDTPSRIKIEANPKADSNDPWYLVNGAGRSAVHLHDDIIRREASRQNVDPDLIRAIIYAENARGHYFGAARAAEGLGKANSIFPMNINPELWRDLGFTGRNASDPATNIEVGARLLSRIRDRLEDPTPEAIGTLYNSLSKDAVTDYGAYVGRLMREKPWSK